MKFQHNSKFDVNKNTYEYVKQYKQQLLENLAKLFDDINIKYVISHGNLIEYLRGSPIYHDDDIDLRININDYDKIKNYFNKNNNKLEKYNLKFDERILSHYENVFKFNGSQCWLIKFNNKYNITEYKMDIHADIVLNKVGSNFWLNYDINYNDLQKIKYYNVSVYIPNKKDCEKVLITQYGKKWIIPEFNYII
jgi:hypothetical protein